MKTAFDLNLLRLLMALSEYQSAEGVIKQLAISHSTFKRGLAQLRSRFGNELFVAQQGRYLATAFTRELLERLSPLMTELDAVLHQSSQQSLKELSGNLSVCLPAYMADAIAPELQTELQEMDSRLRLEIYDWPQSGELLLSAQSPNIAINRFPQSLSKLCVQHKIGNWPLGIFCQPSHPLAQQAHIELHQLQGERIVRYLPLHSQMPAAIRERLAASGTVLEVVAAINSFAAALRYVAMFDALAMGSPTGQLHQAMGLCWRPIRVDDELLSYEYGFFYHRAWYQHPVMREIEQMLRRIHQRLSLPLS